MRPAHMHFMIEAAGYQRLVTHVFRDADRYLDSDPVFGVRSSLVCHWESHPAGSETPTGVSSDKPFHLLRFEFVLQQVEPLARLSVQEAAPAATGTRR